MKRIFTSLSSLVCLMMVFQTGAQQSEIKEKVKEKYEFKKTKEYSKTYSASGNNLSVKNSFGSVKYSTWDKNEIKVDVKVDVSANKEDVAQKLVDAINISDKQKGSSISFETSIKNNNEGCKNCKSNMEINYEVYLPSNVPLTTENSFGNTHIPDYSGSLNIISKFGKLVAGNLASVKDILVEFGEADIKSLNNVDGQFKFSEVSIGGLTGANKMKFEFCDATRISLDGKLSELTINESYSSINLRPASGISVSYSISTSFGTFVDRSGTGIVRTDTPDKYGPDSDKTYAGQSGSGAAKVKVRSSFGRIIVGEPTSEDMAEKKKKNRVKA